jgi:putative nucleotidyltransferase with HDIG domain
MQPHATYLPEAIADPIFAQLGQVSRRLGLRAYVVGGYVRDWLMGLGEKKDLDVVVEGKGVELARAFASEAGASEVVVYENFGTAMVRTRDWVVEFVGARRESYQRDSRKPRVEDGSLADDQLRRDFTINALSLSLQEDDWGMLIDPFGGVADLQAGIIRTPQAPEITFSDDPLRMLRALRFAARFGFSIESQVYEAIRQQAERLRIVSQERITDELNKMILSRQPSAAFRLLFHTGLLELILPEMVRLHGVEQVDGSGHKDNFYHTLQVLDNVAEFSDNLWLRWVAILHDIAKPLTKRYEPGRGWTFHSHEDKGARMTPAIFRRLRLPMGEPMKYVQKLVRLHQRPIALVSEEVSDSAIRRIVMEAGEDLDDLLAFCRADITSKNEKKVRAFRARYDELEARIREVEARDNLRNWQPPVSGEMIMEAFGLPPGPAVGAIKNEIREAILEGIIPNEPEAALAFMREIAPRHLAASPPRRRNA